MQWEFDPGSDNDKSLEVHISVPVQCELDPGSDNDKSLEVYVSVPV